MFSALDMKEVLEIIIPKENGIIGINIHLFGIHQTTGKISVTCVNDVVYAQ